MTLPERIRAWVAENFTDHVDHDMIVEDLIDVAAGNRVGNEFEHKAVSAIMGRD